ncbi:hypothetical protein EZS27_000997 [termite gut metagenome]|uniref:G domain-containing protein n=1 Tax=termite gut metagenome TaxID=433724 RepID=A0A5J4SZC6_9ZZZZ
MIQDEITIGLSNNLKSILDFLNNDLQNKVLEIDTNIRSRNYYEELKRISNSLEQYIKKDIGLFYVGFLGSYSSGKTSTINSLLEIWETDKARKVSNNPTDDCITLITNQSNVQNVFTFAKEGAISIRTATNFDISFLNNIVLMDTPGSGDPNIIESIVRDSLPLCDLIVYTLNATAPFTDIDKPFLVAQQSKLKNIPILFILTRANEFQKNKTTSLSEETFDNNKYSVELQILINRINEAIKICEFTEKDFFIIDNNHRYNIDKLKNKIKSYTENSKENLIVLHNHKLNYFKNEIKIIHDYYIDLSKEKIGKCDKFIEKAEENIKYFDQQINISKLKFNALWTENIQVFSRIYDGNITSYINGLLESLKSFVEISNTIDVTLFKAKMKERITEASNNESRNIITKIEDKAFFEVDKLKSKINELINYESLCLNTQISNDDLNISFPLKFPIGIDDYIKKTIDLYRQKVLHDHGATKDIFAQIQKSLQFKKTS